MEFRWPKVYSKIWLGSPLAQIVKPLMDEQLGEPRDGIDRRQLHWKVLRLGSLERSDVIGGGSGWPDRSFVDDSLDLIDASFGYFPSSSRRRHGSAAMATCPGLGSVARIKME